MAAAQPQDEDLWTDFMMQGPGRLLDVEGKGKRLHFLPSFLRCWLELGFVGSSLLSREVGIPYFLIQPVVGNEV